MPATFSKPHLRPRPAVARALAVALLSMLSLEAAVLTGRLGDVWEAASADLRMRTRLACGGATGRAAPDVTLVAVDARTQAELGKFDSGVWLSREPYADQLVFFERHLKPSVLAYDIVFQQKLGKRESGGISESAEAIRGIRDDLDVILRDQRETLSEDTLHDMSILLSEQGSVFLAHRFAAIMEKNRFPTVVGYYFRGGSVDPQETGTVDAWSDKDVFGGDPSGDEESGWRIPYLTDLAIPDRDIHWPRGYRFAPNANLPDMNLLDYAELGFINCRPDPDGVFRRLPLVAGFEYRNSVTGKSRRAFVCSFALTACLLHWGIDFPLQPGTVQVFPGREIIVSTPSKGDFRIPIDTQGRMYLNFTGRLNDYDAISFRDLAPSRHSTTPEERARLAAAYRPHLDARLVMVGVDAAGVDIGSCPVAATTPLVLVLLTACSNILTRNFIGPVSRAGNAVLMGCLFLVFTALCETVRTSKLALISMATLGCYVSVSFLMVHESIVILPLVMPVAYMVLCSFCVVSFRFFVEERERRKVRRMFATMVSDEVLSYLEENPGSFSVRGHSAETTVFFSDVSGFSAISETLSPGEVTSILNTYLTPVTDSIMEHGGYVDKYVGDGIMAVWGAPYPKADHAAAACESALEQQGLVTDLNGELEHDFGVTMRVRMGINSGLVTAGNVGSQKKFQYTVVGNTVNLAARLETANKEFGTSIVIGEDTRRLAGAGFVTRPLGEIVCAGKREVVQVHELVGVRDGVGQAMLEVLALYEEALGYFYHREWAQCLAILDAVLARGSDGPSSRLRERAAKHQAKEPPDDWSAAYVQTQKR